MIRATIKNLMGEITNQADFESQEIAESWFFKESANGSFGALEKTLVDIDGKPTGEIIPQQFTVEYFDVSEEQQKKNSINRAILAQQLGQEVWANAWVLIKQKGVTDGMADALIEDKTLSAIDRFIKGGFFLDAKRHVEKLDESLFSSEEKLSLIKLLEEADAKVG
jgi:hypothetical protein